MLAPAQEQEFLGSFFQERTDFFFEKKKQKTFARLVTWPTTSRAESLV
jgi:hypothetical protein